MIGAGKLPETKPAKRLWRGSAFVRPAEAATDRAVEETPISPGFGEWSDVATLA